jgi:hypothetical protein
MKSKYTLETYEEYIIFLYIYLASSDFSVHLKEVETILQKMESLCPSKENLQYLFNKVKKQFERIPEEEIEETIVTNFNLFKREIINIDHLMNDFYDIITSDGIIQDYEIEAFEKIKKLIKSEKN